MAFMQRAHGGHKADALSGAMRFLAYGRGFSGGCEGEHGEKQLLAISL
jgi:hypothetical protein